MRVRTVTVCCIVSYIFGSGIAWAVPQRHSGRQAAGRAARRKTAPAAARGPQRGRPTAAEALDRPDRIVVTPDAVKLDSRRACRQCLVTGYFHGEPRDLTREATFQPADSRVVRITAGRIEAAADGQTAVTVRCGVRSVQIPVSVRNTAKPDPVRFKFETLAVLTKQGCASGSCHGSPHGKGGFSLSLFGYDPRIDRISLTRDGINRRTNVLEPAESLLLKKPRLEIPHVGGKRLRPDDAAYQILHDWIYEGASTDLPATHCERILVEPGGGRVLSAPYRRQQLSVLAHFTDGPDRDVTRIATYDTSDPNVASVDPEGLVTAHSRGQAAISVRYLDRLESVYITVIEPVRGFVWKAPPENNLVDTLTHAKLKQLQYLPSETCGDSTFLRRVSLDLTGLLPRPDQARQFLQDRTPDRRARLIDALLETQEYAHFQALKKADLMRVSPARLKDGRAEIFAGWLVNAMRTNMPYDRFARAILTASGDTEQTATANYFLAIPSPEERTEMTAQIFMGSRVECAKCHNHPFENWTMRDYYSMTAVFARTQVDDGMVTLAQSGETVLPTTRETMLPWGLPKDTLPADTDRRVAFTDWLVRPDNPFFARVEVNRIWADLMGRGIVEPVDDFRSSNPPSNVPLLNALAEEFRRSGYDRKRIIRLICNSRTYQSETRANPFNQTDDRLFSHARMRMLTAEQLRDALGMATRTLEPPDRLATRLEELRKQMDRRTTEIESRFAAWLKEQSERVAQLPFRSGAWYAAGPFQATDLNQGVKEAFAPENGPVDLNATYGDGLRWKLQPRFRDGVAHALAQSKNRVYYLYRRLYTTEASVLDSHIKANDRVLVWLNGQRLTRDPLQRESAVKLNLQKGENHLLIKVVNARTPTRFTFSFSEITRRKRPDAPAEALPPYAVDLLTIPAERRTAEQNGLVHACYLEQDGELKRLRQQIARLDGRMEYATQRAYPESSAFMSTFGQPKRESACTCERQNTPTLLQALELLNGGAAYEMAQSGAKRYAAFPDDRTIEEIYLSALSRFPTEQERTTAKRYLTRNPARRNTAVVDLLWTVINTREFLFQH